MEPLFVGGTSAAFRFGSAFLASWLLALPARSTEPTPSSAPFGQYELRVLRAELSRQHLEIEPNPEGKLISDVDIVTLDVFDESDPIPDFFNVFHVTSLKRVIRRELLLLPGHPFRQRSADESVRNLRSLPQLSLVVLVPVKDRAGGVRLLLIAKDIWSLRLNWNVQLGPGGLTYLYLNPSERNAFGTHLTVGGTFELFRSRYAAGGALSHGRLFGSRLRALLAGGVYVNRASGETEGSFGQFSYGLPKYSETQRWSYGVSLHWDEGITRVSVRLPNQPYPVPTEEHYGTGGSVLFPYHRESYYEVAQATRSFGVRRKLDLSFGAEADRRVYRASLPLSISPQIRSDFDANEVPVSDTRVLPFVQLSLYDNDFMKTIEVEALGLQEEIRLGPQVLLKGYATSQRVGSSRDIAGLFAGVSYTLPIENGFVRAVAQSLTEHANDHKDQAMVALGLRVVTPRFGFGRLHVDGVLENRYRNYLRDRSPLGGNGRLRGYASADTEVSGSLRGSDLAVLNVEYRSPGVEILSFQCGLAAFYDVGGTAPDFASLEVKHSAGVGLRFLLPNFDRTVFRADWAFPLNVGYEHFPGAFFFTAGQAFSLPRLGDCLSCIGEARPVTYGLSGASW